MNNNNTLMKVAEIAQTFDVSERTIMTWLKLGMPRYQVGKTLRFDLDKVKEWMETRGEDKL